MKLIISTLLLIGSLGYAQFALSDCNYPRMNVDIPNGSKASMEDMVAAQASFKAYNSNMNTYLECLDDELSKVEPLKSPIIQISEIEHFEQVISKIINDEIYRKEITRMSG